MTQKLSYCGQAVKAQDPDRFLLSMFAPVDCREALWALFAFNAEIAKTREVVSETQLGLIRLQWWRDAIATIYDRGEAAQHEILVPLARAIQAYDLPREHFEALLYAREFDLEDVLPGNLEGLVNYADFTSTPLCKLAVQVMGGNAETEPVQPVASSYALAGILRAVPFHAQQRRCYLPEDLMALHSAKGLYDMRPNEGYKEIVRAVAGEVVLDAAPENRLLKAMQALTKIYIKQIDRLGFDVFHPKMGIDPPFKTLRIILSVM